jgi:hypothetical protein
MPVLLPPSSYFILAKYYQDDKIKENEMGGAYDKHRREEKRTQRFGRKI